MLANERVCNVCKTDNIEDEKHFLFECETYTDIRNTFLNHCSINNHEFLQLSYEQQISYIMNIMWKKTINHIASQWDIRRAIIYR